MPPKQDPPREDQTLTTKSLSPRTLLTKRTPCLNVKQEDFGGRVKVSKNIANVRASHSDSTDEPVFKWGIINAVGRLMISV